MTSLLFAAASSSRGLRHRRSLVRGAEACVGRVRKRDVRFRTLTWLSSPEPDAQGHPGRGTGGPATSAPDRPTLRCPGGSSRSALWTGKQRRGRAVARGMVVVGTGFGCLTHAPPQGRRLRCPRLRGGRERTAERSRRFANPHALTSLRRPWPCPGWTPSPSPPRPDPRRAHLQAVAAGKHVLCEKPLARDTAEAKTMLARPSRPGSSIWWGPSSAGPPGNGWPPGSWPREPSGSRVGPPPHSPARRSERRGPVVVVRHVRGRGTAGSTRHPSHRPGPDQSGRVRGCERRASLGR